VTEQEAVDLLAWLQRHPRGAYVGVSVKAIHQLAELVNDLRNERDALADQLAERAADA
jgi:hypothetical protein